ncbi:PadR family transcriptional regulator [Tuberibacillus sp. Marseille-P3662]|uniref:PadR family transcriptional regulator n=1 Tax=Tuberibacillus sp. Marseille-P3662 TaxID=1965358 RepID=UPI00159422A1|nr:PadR family transcriptional regulator [Tuberibacillus sp. Marseille-P3662]
MNTLSYGILGMIQTGPCSGYDIMNNLKPFREVKHSQIYRLLSELENEAYVTSKLVEQSGRPNKKIYDITEKGKKEIEEWFFKPNTPATLRDEFVLKAYLIGLKNSEEAKELFRKRIEHLRNKERICKERLEVLQESCEGVLTDFQSLAFGRYILLRQVLHQTYGDIRWCEWVIDLLEKDNINFLNYPF